MYEWNEAINAIGQLHVRQLNKTEWDSKRIAERKKKWNSIDCFDGGKVAQFVSCLKIVEQDRIYKLDHSSHSLASSARYSRHSQYCSE